MTTGTKKWIALAAAVMLLLTGYMVAGPYLAMRGIQRCLDTHQLDELPRYVDFPALRENIRAQVDDRLLAAADPQTRGPLGQLAVGVVRQLSDYTVQAMVSPRGIALLLEGRALARRVDGSDARTEPTSKDEGYKPLQHAQTRFESASRFSATVESATGRPVVFVFSRVGLGWKLSDIRLPPEALGGG